MIPPVSYNRSHAAVFSQTHILTRNISRRFEALSRCCFFGRLFFAVRVTSLCCCRGHSSHSFAVLLIFEQFFRKFDRLLTSLISSFALCCSPVLLLRSLQPQFFRHTSRFRTVFFENSTGCDVISFVVRFVLQCCVVVEFHSSHSYSSSSFSLLPPPTPTPGHTFVFFLLFSGNMDEAAIQLQIQQAVAAAMAAHAAVPAAGDPPVPV